MPNPRDTLRQLASFGTLDDPQIAVRLSTGLTGFLSRWESECLSFVAAGGAELRFVEGPNGRGKTHFLQTLEVTARRAGFVTARVQCGMQHKPFASLAETYRAIADSMSAPTDNDVNGASHGVTKLLAHISTEQLHAFKAAARGNPGFRNLVDAYTRRAVTGLIHEPVTAGLRALLHHDISLRVTFTELFRLERHLPRPLGRIGKRNAAVWLRSLLTMSRQLGFRGLIVMFDETGSDLHLRPEPLRLRQQHMANLRNLVDHLATGGTPGCAVIYATTNDFIQMAREDYPAMSQRVERLEETTPFALPPRNPRAIWCRLDELTQPGPDQAGFYIDLGNKLATLAEEGRVSAKRVEAVRAGLPAAAQRASQSISQGAVRAFIKRTATELLNSA